MEPTRPNRSRSKDFAARVDVTTFALQRALEADVHVGGGGAGGCCLRCAMCSMKVEEMVPNGLPLMNCNA
jgi:hypothetical protein